MNAVHDELSRERRMRPLTESESESLQGQLGDDVPAWVQAWASTTISFPMLAPTSSSRCVSARLVNYLRQYSNPYKPYPSRVPNFQTQGYLQALLDSAWILDPNHYCISTFLWLCGTLTESRPTRTPERGLNCFPIRTTQPSFPCYIYLATVRASPTKPCCEYLLMGTAHQCALTPFNSSDLQIF